MTRRSLFPLVLVLSFVLGLAALPAAASAHVRHRPAPTPTVTVDGTVATPATYSLGDLKALPQASFTVTGPRHRTASCGGVSVQDLVTTAQPTLPDVKNALLRVTLAVRGDGRRGPVTFALGELDPSFGNHPAYLALQCNGRSLRKPALVVPGDRPPARTLRAVRRITVAVQSPVASSAPAGALRVTNGDRTTILTAEQLGALPTQTVEVTYGSGSGQQQHVETGPRLDAVLRAAGVRTSLSTWVAAIGSDGYVSTVTPAEAWVGGRPLLISLNEDGVALAQPRLVAAGDIKGGRYVSGLVEIAIGNDAAPRSPWRARPHRGGKGHGRR